ncbi:MAG: methyltransferase [Nanoarchaeota archaeon]|nr:methyltransferase [Nanoarchaeota archaeon]
MRYIAGIFALIIYLPILFLITQKDFRSRFSKINSKGFDLIIESLIGILYFVVIFYSFFVSVKLNFFLIIGILIYFPALFLTYRGYFVFYKSKGLITQDIYSISRNPTYFFGFVSILGIALMNLSWEISILLVLLFLLTHRIVLNEEKYLGKKYGRKYLDYKKRVGRWI